MWLLRRKTPLTEKAGEVLPPSAGPMRRIEITVERHSISRVSQGGSNAVAKAAGVEPEPGPELVKPPGC